MKRDLDVWLKALVRYLRKKVGIGPMRVLHGISIERSNRAEVNNQRSARSFCYVFLDGKPIIYHAEALESLDPQNVVAILLHEIAHLVVKSGPVDDEVDADQWIIDHVPESKYHYADVVYMSPWTRRMRTAKSLQCVSRDFVWSLVE